MREQDKVKVLWVSRHDLAQEQFDTMCERLGLPRDKVDAEKREVTWQATENELADLRRNKAEWKILMDTSPIIAGVFPPVAIEALKKGRPKRLTLLTPVSKQAPELRKGDGPIPFVHVRWCCL